MKYFFLFPILVWTLGVFERQAYAADEPPQVHAFYYPWYRNPTTDGRYEHWNHAVAVRSGPPRSFPGGDDIGANFYPRLGNYSTNDRPTVATHMRQMRNAGVDVVSVSWWGRDSDTDNNVSLLLDEAERAGLTINFHIEPFGGRTARTTREALVYLIDTYGKHKAFSRDARFGNRPMVYVYDSYLVPADDWETILSPKGSNTIRDTPYDAIVVGLWVKKDDGFKLAQAYFDGAYTYFATDGFTYGSTIANWPRMADIARDAKLLFVPCVGPGYEDRRIRPWNGKNTRSRDNGRYYDRMFEAAIKVDPTTVAITSFNEWHEGTQIEPAIPKKISGYKYEDYAPQESEFYLTRTRHWADQLHRND